MIRLFPDGELNENDISIQDRTFYYQGKPYELYPIDYDEPMEFIGLKDDKNYVSFKLVDSDGEIRYFTPNNIKAKPKQI